jgi:hypothetical protein
MSTCKDDADELAREQRAKEILDAVDGLISGEQESHPPQSPRELTDRAANEKRAARPTIPFKKR